MPRRRKPPTYLSFTGPDGVKRARTVLRWPDGRVEHKSLGHYGSPESYAEHARLVAEWRAAWGAVSDVTSNVRESVHGGPVRTVTELCASYWQAMSAEKQGKADLANLKDALRPLKRLYGHTPAREFGPKALKALRLALVRGDWLTHQEKEHRHHHNRPLGMSRRYLNRHLHRIRRLFAWAESEELVPAGTHHALLTVESLREGELGVREADDVPPAAPADVEAACRQLPPALAALVRVQLLSGARPGEVVRLTPGDLLRGGSFELAPGLVLDTGGCWVYAPAKHKTAYRNHRRVVLFGPRAQAVLAPLILGKAPDEPIFPPPASNVCRAPGRTYGVRAYCRAVARACRRAGVPAFSPNQLRHLAATEITREFGIDVARLVLGHRKVDITQVYALPDLARAVEAISRVG